MRQPGEDARRAAYDKLTDRRLGESSETVRARVETARENQRLRFLNIDLACNADMRPGDVRTCCKLDDAGTSLMRTAMSQFQLSARGFAGGRIEQYSILLQRFVLVPACPE